MEEELTDSEKHTNGDELVVVCDESRSNGDNSEANDEDREHNGSVPLEEQVGERLDDDVEDLWNVGGA